MQLSGYYGRFGGSFVPEILVPALEELEAAFLEAQADAGFRAELATLLATYAGRPTPLYQCRNLGTSTGSRIWLKREDLLHGGAHKTDQALGQGLLAKRLAKTRIIAETDARQHGVATALEKHGPIFIAIIADYCREHPEAKESCRPERRRVISSGPGPKRRHVIIGEAYNSGESVASLEEKFNVKQSTILDNLLEYHREGHPLRPEGLTALITVSDQQRTRAMDTFKELGADFLRPVFEALNGEIGYEDLKILRLYHVSLRI